MYKGSSDQNASTEMFAEEEYRWRNLHPLDLLCNNWKPTSSDGRSEHNDCPKIRLRRIQYKVATYTLQPREEGSRTRQHPPYSRIVASPW
jgi:hypothetical protein